MARKHKAKLGLGVIIQLYTTLLCLGLLCRNFIIIKPVSYVTSLTLENHLTWYLELTFGID